MNRKLYHRHRLPQSKQQLLLSNQNRASVDADKIQQSAEIWLFI